jgi:hypothetical protein
MATSENSLLSRIEILSSIEILRVSAFVGCPCLTEIVFPLDTRLQAFSGFRDSASLYRLEIHSFVEVIAGSHLIWYPSLTEIVFPEIFIFESFMDFAAPSAFAGLPFFQLSRLSHLLPSLDAHPRLKSFFLVIVHFEILMD